MNLHHLQIFRAVAKAKSVSRAADELLISQPAVSKQLKEFEGALKVRLLNRSVRGAVLTEAGELLLGYADRIFGLVDDAEAGLRDLNALRRGKLSIGVTSTIGTYLLPTAVVYLRQRYPGVEIRMEVQSAARLRSLLEDHTLDVAFSPVDFTSDLLERGRLWFEEVVPVVRAGHHLARKRKPTAKEFLAEPFIARETPSGSGSFIETALAEKGLRLRPAMTFGNTEAVKQAVSVGLGVALVSRFAIEHELASKRLAVLQIPALHFRRALYHVRPRLGRENRLVPAVITVLKHVIRGTLPEKPRFSLR